MNAEQKAMERGIDWAYQVLVDNALVHSKDYVKSRAAQFRTEVLEACIGMACADIDWQQGKKVTSYAYQEVKEICEELVKERV